MDEEEQHAGLGGGGGWAGFQTLVYDPKLSAGRGVQYSAAAAAGDVSTLLLLLLAAHGWLLTTPRRCTPRRRKWEPLMTRSQCTTTQRARKQCLPAPAGRLTAATKASSCCSAWAGEARDWAGTNMVRVRVQLS